MVTRYGWVSPVKAPTEIADQPHARTSSLSHDMEAKTSRDRSDDRSRNQASIDAFNLHDKRRCYRNGRKR